MTCCTFLYENGSEKMGRLPNGWSVAKVSFRRKNGIESRRLEILDMRKEEPFTRYRYETMSTTAFKCCKLACIGIPLYSAFYLATHLIRVPFITISTLSPQVFLGQIWTIVRAPFYLIALECAALYGLYRPLEGRALFGELSIKFHHRTYLDDVRHLKEDSPFEKIFWEFLTDPTSRHTFMAGVCMVPIGKTQDQNVINWKILDPQVLD